MGHFAEKGLFKLNLWPKVVGIFSFNKLGNKLKIRG